MATSTKKKSVKKKHLDNANNGSRSATGTLTDRLVRLRQDREAQAKVVTAIEAKVTLALRNRGEVADTVFHEQEAAERKLRALDTTIQSILKELPSVRAQEGQSAGERQVRALVAEREQLLGKGLSTAADARGRTAFALTQALEAEQGLYQRIGNAEREIDLLCKRFPGGAAVPKLKRAPSPPTAADIIRTVEMVYASRTPLRPLTVPRGASDTPEQIRRSTARALANYFKRHAGSLSKETRAVLDLAGTLDTTTETPEQRARRQEREEKAAAEARAFTEAIGGDQAKARAGTRRGL